MTNKQSSPAWGKLTSLNVDLDNLNLTKDSYTFGRRSDCDFVMNDTRLSNVHCRISKTTDLKIYIEDLSLNGTFLDD